MAFIEDQTFCVGRACDSPRNKPVPFKFARREDDNIASDPQTVKCSVHIHDQTAAFPMDREDDEKINIAARVRLLRAWEPKRIIRCGAKPLTSRRVASRSFFLSTIAMVHHLFP